MRKSSGNETPELLDLANEVLTYNSETGEFFRKVKRGRWPAGAKVGYPQNTGYTRIRIGYIELLAHRLAFAMHHKRWPSEYIDHIDGNKKNNSINNLRECTPAQNQWNRKTPKHNRLGLKGVNFHGPTGLWRAQVVKNGVRVHLGIFADPDEAKAAYDTAAKFLHGQFYRVG